MKSGEVLGTYDDRAEAMREASTFAEKLRKMRLTARSGVRVDPRQGVWWLTLTDRRRR